MILAIFESPEETDYRAEESDGLKGDEEFFHVCQPLSMKSLAIGLIDLSAVVFLATA